MTSLLHEQKEDVLDKPSNTSDNTVLVNKLNGWLLQLSDALNAQQVNSVADLFESDGYWRDLLTLTWNIYTAEGRQAIVDMLQRTNLSRVIPIEFKLTDASIDDSGVIFGLFEFSSKLGTGHGAVRLRNNLCWTFMCSMESLHGYEEPMNYNRWKGTVHKVNKITNNHMQVYEIVA